MDEEQRSIAIEEWRLSYEAVRRLEERIHKIHGWMLALVTGLTILVLKDNPPVINSYEYLLLCLMLVALIISLEIFLRVPVHYAIARSRQIEKALRGEGPYEGPILSSQLGTKPTFQVLFVLFKRLRIWAPYVVLLLFAAVAAYIAR